MPDLEVHDFGSADTDGDAQHLPARNPLTESCVETGAGLLNQANVESRGIGYRLNVVSVIKVCLVRRDCWMLPNIQARDGLGKPGTEIRVFFAAVPSPPGGVNTQLHEIGDASSVPGAWCSATRQSAEAVEANGPLAL